MTRTTVYGPDAFAGTSGTQLETYNVRWVPLVNGGGFVTLATGGKIDLSFTTASSAVYRENTGTYTDDQYAISTIGGLAINGSIAGLIGRSSTDTGAGADYWALEINDNGVGATQTEFYKVANGTKTSVDIRSTVPWVNGDSVAFEVIGQSPNISLVGYRNGASYLTMTGQSGQDTGKPGLLLRGNSHCMTIAGWEGGNYTAAAPAPPPPMASRFVLQAANRASNF